MPKADPAKPVGDVKITSTGGSGFDDKMWADLLK
jgi:hypothetical protein